ncbi:response regulator [bacterium]|nr:response regulator [bacterium]
MENNRKIKIVIVDDEYAILVALKLALEEEFDISITLCAEECLEYLYKCKPDIVLTDYNMPGMNGIQLIEKVTRGATKIKTIIYSANLNEEIKSKAIKMDVFACLSKPFDIGVLRVLLRNAMKKNDVM